MVSMATWSVQEFGALEHGIRVLGLFEEHHIVAAGALNLGSCAGTRNGAPARAVVLRYLWLLDLKSHQDASSPR